MYPFNRLMQKINGDKIQIDFSKTELEFCEINKMEIKLQILDASNTVRGPNSRWVDFHTFKTGPGPQTSSYKMGSEYFLG